MGIGATNSIHNDPRAIRKQIDFELGRIEIEKKLAKKRQIQGCRAHFRVRATKCSQCGLGMDNKIARLQKENKRENAPICIPCILGKKRIPKVYE